MRPAPDLLDRRLLWVTGKGGVGKSTVAAALGLLAAERGQRVLLVEVDAKGNLTDSFERTPVGYSPAEVYPGISAMTMSTEGSLLEYLRIYLHIPFVGRIAPLARIVDFTAKATPGAKELLTTGKICFEVRKALDGHAPWDIVIVDALASGHVVAQLSAAQAFQQVVQTGRIRSQVDWMSDILSDPAITAVNIVVTPEEMPVAETVELVERIRTETTAPLGSIIVNRVLPELFNRTEEAAFEALLRPEAAEVLDQELGVGALRITQAARLAVSLRRTGAGHLASLRERVDLPLLYLPYVFARAHGVRVTRLLAGELAGELGV
ncbi:MAG: ArsA family ATPase [Acidimicrobiia bacterium]